MNYSIEEKLAGIATLREALITDDVSKFYINELGYYNDDDRLNAICLHLTWLNALLID